MKLRYIFLTIALIVLAHLIVLYICFHQPGNEKKPAVPEKLVRTLPAEEAKAAPASVRTPAAAAESVRTERTVSKQGRRFHRFPVFNYHSAWKGDIREIPASVGVRGGVLVDADTGNVLWDKNANLPVPIASMTKIMTLLLACEDVRSGRNGISFDSPVKISRATMKIGGSQVWLDEREIFKLEDLLRAVAIKSANDAAYQVAEFLGDGDVYGFVSRMNRRARELGMKNTRFHNPHGLPGKTSADDNVSSPADMALLAEFCLGHEKIMEWAALPRSDFRNGKTELINHNNLLPGRRFPSVGVDGLKTGFINRSGYCVTITCKRGGKRMIAVVTGFDTAKNRDLFTRQLLDWGYARAADPAAANARSAKLKPVQPKNRSPKRRSAGVSRKNSARNTQRKNR